MKGVRHWYQTMDLQQRGRLLVAASLLLGLTAAWLVHTKVADLETQFGTEVSVLVASQEIAPESTVQESMLTQRTIVMRYFLPEMVRASDKVNLVGRVSLVKVPQGQVLTDSMFSTNELDTTSRTYMLVSSSSVVLGDLQAGDLVDVLVVYRNNTEDKSEIAMKSLQVVEAKTEKDRLAVILSLTPTQAEKLAWYENFAKQVRLLKRA